MKLKDLLPKIITEAKEKPTSIGAVNREIKFSRGLDIELVKGRGYFYFVGDDIPSYAPSTSVMVYRITDLTVAQWLQELDDILKQAEDAK